MAMQPGNKDFKSAYDTAMAYKGEPMVDFDRMRVSPPAGVRKILGDGNFGGHYEKPDQDMLALWEVAVAETRELIEGPWS